MFSGSNRASRSLVPSLSWRFEQKPARIITIISISRSPSRSGRTLSMNCRLPILGGDDQLQKLLKQGVDHAFLGVGTTGNTKPRQKLYELAKGMGFQFVSAIHSQAIISPSVRIGQGASIMAGAVINPEVR